MIIKKNLTIEESLKIKTLIISFFCLYFFSIILEYKVALEIKEEKKTEIK